MAWWLLTGAMYSEREIRAFVFGKIWACPVFLRMFVFHGSQKGICTGIFVELSWNLQIRSVELPERRSMDESDLGGFRGVQKDVDMFLPQVAANSLQTHLYQFIGLFLWARY